MVEASNFMESEAQICRYGDVATCSVRWNDYIGNAAGLIMERKRSVRMRSIKSGTAKWGVRSGMIGAFFV